MVLLNNALAMFQDIYSAEHYQVARVQDFLAVNLRLPGECDS